MRQLRFLAALICIASFAPGCAEEWGPTRRDVIDLDGRLRLGGTPIGGGWVEFIPIDGALGDVRAAKLNPDGTFHATKVARGRNVVRVLNPPVNLGVDRVYQQFYSPVRPVIEAGQKLDIDLRIEALRARSRTPAD